MTAEGLVSNTPNQTLRIVRFNLGNLDGNLGIKVDLGIWRVGLGILLVDSGILGLDLGILGRHLGWIQPNMRWMQPNPT